MIKEQSIIINYEQQFVANWLVIDYSQIFLIIYWSYFRTYGLHTDYANITMVSYAKIYHDFLVFYYN